MQILERHAPLKRKYVRANQCPFMTKELRKAVMKRSQLRNAFNKNKLEINKMLYRKQRNLCTNLVKKAKRDYYSNLKPSSVKDTKRFWKTVKPLFSDKIVARDNIVLNENDRVIDDDEKISEMFSDFFSNVVSNLNISKSYWGEKEMENCNFEDPILKAISNHHNHPSIIKIRESINPKEIFSFKHTNYESVYKEVIALNNSTACPIDSIPPKIIKQHCDLFTQKLENDFNHTVSTGTYPNNMKNADITPAHKSNDRTDKTNYRPVSILPSISKIFERLLYSQINAYMDSKLSIYQCGFRKGFSSQQCLLLMIERWRQSIDKNGKCGSLLTDLSKAFDCLDHNLMIAKLNEYGFDYNAVKLVHSYLTNRYQRVKVNSCHSSWTEIINGVPQGSILGPLIFNIYLSDLFLFFKDSHLASYADDNTPYACETHMDLVLEKLQLDSKYLIQWVKDNSLKANANKFHLLLNEPNSNISIHVDNLEIFSSNCEKLLGVKLDNKLNFNEHVSSLCKNASKKLHALARVAHYMTIEKRRIIMKTFINSHFNYCPLVWMFHSRSLNNRINRIQERALRIVYNDNLSTFKELLCKDNSVTIHVRNIQMLAIEVYKVINGLSTKIMNEILQLKENSLYCTRFPFKSGKVRTVAYGIQSISYMGPKIWTIVPESIKQASSLNEFKRKIKSWNPQNCPCRLCKTFIAGVGFVEIIT